MLLLVLVALNIPAWLFLPPVVFPAIFTGISAMFYIFVFNFFRCPVRRYRGERKRRVVSSVDGKVVVIEETEEPEFIKGPAIQFSVFMSPLNVHANWFPIDGEVVYVKHHSGRFLSAYLPKSSTENERSTIGIITPEGHKVAVRQIAGAMARRIVTYARKGEEASIDEHLGFIKFGSRVDIFLPLGSDILVELGDVTRGGVTQVAVLPHTS
ncbi:MAG: phosphatidylserine decarboxylase family protein [Prevotella sp.]|nr:phosphatidylserine decarboxylase family protein [Bacteroides sp.]MCM1366491.1 phosphatidylserine decarboxylase family protein [Prevotella sp.]MCM1436830.1 phosphatidylserine decarboxylase family protein [Prevotella sp.]